MDNINENKTKLYLGILLLLFMTMLSIFFSLNDYVGFFKRDDVITFSWKSAGAIWFSPVLIYISFTLYRISLGKVKRLNSKIGNYVSYVSITGIILTLFVSFYVDDELKSEGYLICSKSSWMAPNKYVKDISLCH
ncbi:hypothetical protein TI10_19415 [Photorhabdus luminescens subsp. luminescens]|uniref:DUF1240 domain-containing protein n=1 Tax=Photorhabdus TaxID=29487 RepID=UPI00067222D3|nr:DUF1240 domain-containing protein [Photorhabdus luminescens]KMW71763.1 hypothetical protein TI10_19415 [Photorhabdus luminescens subsp. luminescens]